MNELIDGNYDDKYFETDSVKFYLHEINSKPLLSDEEFRILYFKMKSGDNEARSEIIERNLKLVVSVAKKYIGRGVDLLDLISVGNMGLMTAIDKYEYDEGTKFSTYAYYWIQQRILRTIHNDAKTIRLPVHLYGMIGKISRIQNQLAQELNREPTDEEVAKRMNISTDRLREILKNNQEPISFETSYGKEDDLYLGDMVKDEESITPEEYAEQENLKDYIKRYLHKLKPREREIIELRFGFINDKCYTLEEVGKKYNLTRERIRQIEAKVLKKLYKLISTNEKYLQTKKTTSSIKREKTVARKKRTVYEFFRNYQKDEIDAVLLKLSNDEKALLEKRERDELTKEETNKYYRILFPKIRKLLENERQSKIRSKKNMDERKECVGKDGAIISKEIEESVAKDFAEPIKDDKKENEELPKQDELPKYTIKEEKKMGRKVKDIYEYFSEFSKEQIDAALLKLKDDERALIEKRQNGKLTDEEIKKYYGTIISKMKRLLGIKKNNRVKSDSAIEDELPKYEVVTEKVNKDEENNLQDEVKEEVIIIPNEELSKNEETTLTKNDYIRVLELLKTKSFNDMLSVLSVKEAVIIALKLGYIDGLYFSTEKIAQFLGIEELEVIEITKKVLLLYKESINEFIDEAINMVSDKIIR